MQFTFTPSGNKTALTLDTDLLQDDPEREGSYKVTIGNQLVRLNLIRDMQHDGHRARMYDVDTAAGRTCCFILRLDDEWCCSAGTIPGLHAAYTASKQRVTVVPEVIV